MPRLCELYPGICLTTEEKARKNLSQGSRRVPVGTIQTKRYATKYTARVQSVRQTQRNFAIFYFKPCNDSVTRIVTSIALMFKAILMKIHSWEEDKTQYLLTVFAAITAL